MDREETKVKSPRGFAAMSRDKHLELSAKGGKASMSPDGAGHRFTSAEAYEASVKGQKVRADKRARTGRICLAAEIEGATRRLLCDHAYVRPIRRGAWEGTFEDEHGRVMGHELRVVTCKACMKKVREARRRERLALAAERLGLANRKEDGDGSKEGIEEGSGGSDGEEKESWEGGEREEC